MTFICEEGCDETLCVNCCVTSRNKKRCCFNCKIAAERTQERKSQMIIKSQSQSEEQKSPTNSEPFKREVSRPLSTFEKTSELTVNRETGKITGWDSLWIQLELDDKKKKEFQEHVEGSRIQTNEPSGNELEYEFGETLEEV